MQRDLDLVRTILLELEAHADYPRPLTLQAPGYSPEQVTYHVKILHEAGYIEALDMSTFDGVVWRPTSLTWQGHEFLDATRHTGVWHKVKAELKDKGISLPFTLIQQLALKIAAAYVGLPGAGK